MELRVLQYFLMVAREENITRAAELLHITQPTLSRQLMQLEEELGVTLFHRGKRRITLTADGMLLRRRAEELVSLAEKTVTELSRSDNVLSGTVAIGSGEYKSTSFLATLIQDFQQAHPQVQFQIYSGTADNIQERIAHGLLDLGLLAGACGHQPLQFCASACAGRMGRIYSHRPSARRKICRNAARACRAAALLAGAREHPATNWKTGSVLTPTI